MTSVGWFWTVWTWGDSIQGREFLRVGGGPGYSKSMAVEEKGHFPSAGDRGVW